MIELRDISVCFEQRKKEIQAIDSTDLTIEKGDVYGIVGYSGAGKSTLVRVMNLLQKPATGEVIVNQTDLNQLSPEELRKERKTIDMIFQHFNLMESRTVFDSVDFSLEYSGKSKQERRQKVNELLKLIGLEEKASAYPRQLSGRQKQRVAIARALADKPKVLLYDEATSALDPKTTLQIPVLSKKLNRRLGLAVILITHRMQVVREICNKIAVMEAGKIVEKGNSIQTFSHPEEESAKDFIRIATHLDRASGAISAHAALTDQIANKWLVELSYIGNQTNEPLIAHLYSRYQITANTLYGNVELLREIPLESLVITLAGETKQQQKALDYLIESGVKVTILQKDGLDNRIKVIEGGN